MDGQLPVVTCSPASGSNFPIGATLVTCSATDASGNTGTATFTVTVTLVDTTPPVISVPPPVTAEAMGPSGAPVMYAATAVDNIDGTIPPACAPPSGSTFPLGTTLVSCTATDAHGNAATASFTITVRDTTPPALTVPAPMTVTATGNSGAVVTFTASAVDLVDLTRPVTCSPASGSTFPVGTTTVTCTAADTRGNTATSTFTVTVKAAVFLGRFVAFGSERTWLRAKATVFTGDVGANESLNERGNRIFDPRRDGDHDFKVEVRIGPMVTLIQPGSRVMGDTVRLDSKSSVYDVTYNELVNRGGTILGTATDHVTLPLLTLPALPAIQPGNQDVTVAKNATVTLAAGQYRHVRVRQGGTLVLSGGLYQVQSLEVESKAAVSVMAPTEVRVKAALGTDAKAKIVAHASAPTLRASQIVFYVAGIDNDCRHDGQRA